MFFKKGHNNEDTGEIICKTMLIRHSGTIDGEKNPPTTNPQEIQSFRDTCIHKRVTTFFIFYIKLFEQFHEQFKKIWVK